MFRCKGIKKKVIKKNITHEDYQNCLFTGKEQLRKVNVKEVITMRRLIK